MFPTSSFIFKTQKAREQGWEVNVGPKIKHPYNSTYVLTLL